MALEAADMIAFPRSLQPASREQPVRDQASNRGESTADQSLVENLDVRYKATIVVPPML